MKIVELSMIYTASDNGRLYYGADLTKRVSRKKPKTLADAIAVVNEMFGWRGDYKAVTLPDGMTTVQALNENGRGYRAIIAP